jgi:CRP/FNR family transcriptional regulator, anaerobic regulatory protein
MDKEILISALRKFAALEAPLESLLLDFIRTTRHLKGELLISPGFTCTRISFIEKGLVSGYRIKGNKERTKYFMGEGDIFISIRSFLTQTPAIEYIECMEDCILHSITFEELEKTLTKYPSFQRHRADILQYYYLLSAEREEMREMDTYDRYCYLMENQSHLINRIKDKYLASYLNMAKSTFSRNKKKFKKNAKHRR